MKAPWLNPEQSGSGFLIEVENDKLLGYHFGFGEAGESIRALFDGQLQDATDEGGLFSGKISKRPVLK